MSESMPSLINIPQMYKVTVNRQQNNWGIPGYIIPRAYQDPVLIKKKREWAVAKKGIKTNAYVTRKGHYLDDINKTISFVPGPGQYKVIKEIQKSKVIKPVLKIQTFIEQIFRKAQRQKFPSPSNYNVLQTQQQLKARLQKYKSKKIPITQKLNYLNYYQSASNQIPGPGNYNPHLQIKKIKQINKTPKQFIKYQIQKKKKTDQRLKSMPSPKPHTYHPYPVDYDLFGKKLQYPKIEQKRQYFGGDGIKKIVKDKKKKVDQNGPGPHAYKINNHWNGKQEGLKKIKSQPWFKNISMCPSKNIYYS